ncbi:hypothetical protein AB0G57_36355, partial [Streptomyces lavendulae]
MRFTIDTETDSYEDAIRTVRAAYGKPQPEPGGRPVVLPEDGACPRVVDTSDPGPGRGRVGGIFYGDEGLLA